MATSSSTRPPTPGAASREAEGDQALDAPGQEVPIWEPPSVAEPSGGASAPPPPVEVPPREEPLPRRDTPLASVIVDPAGIAAPPEASSPGTVTPPPGTPLPVLLLVDQARSASGEEQQELARRINRLLDQMARDGRSRHVADWFHGLIDSGKLEGLEDAAGRDCQETAIRGLLSMGFPYALEISPEHLERIRPREQKPGRRRRHLKGAASGVLVGGLLTQLGLDVGRSGGTLSGVLTLEVGAMLLALALLLSGPARSVRRKLGLALLLVTSLLGIFLGFTNAYAGLVSGLAGLVAFLLFAIHES